MRLFATFLAVLSILLLSPAALATVSSETSRVSYTGNGAADTYSYTFRIFSNTDLLVTVRDDATPATETTLTLTTDYTVTGVGAASGGTIVLVDSGQAWLDAEGDLKSGYVLIIRRVRPITQTTSIKNQGPYYPLLHENAFDHFIMVAQQLKHELSFSIKKRETDEAGDLYIPLEADRASKVFAWDSDGEPIAVDYGTTVTNGDGLQAGNNLSDLQDLPTAQSNLGLDTAAFQPVEAFEPADPAIQAHLLDTSNPHQVVGTQVGNTVAQWNANQILGVPVDDTDEADGTTLIYNAALGTLEYMPGGGGGGGFATADNVGTAGEGFFKQRVGNTIELKNLAAGDTNIVVTDDPGTDSIQLSLPITSQVVGVDDAQVLTGKRFAQDVLPDTTATHDLGSSSFRWKDGYFSGGIVVDGDLQVQGTTTTVNTQTLSVEDATIRVNVGGTDASAEEAGMIVEGTGASDLGLIGYMDAAASKFAAGPSGDLSEILTVDHAQEIKNKFFSDAVIMDEQTSVSAPAAGKVALYPKSDGKLYYQNSAGTEAEVGSEFADAAAIDYDNTTSGLTATNVQQAIDEVHEAQASGGWRKFTFDYTALSDAAATNSAVVLNLPAGDVIESMVLRHTTAFGGGSISEYSVSVGVSTDSERYLTPLDVSQTVDGGLYKAAVFGSGPEHFSNLTSVTLFAEATGDTLDQATSGELSIWVKTSKLP